MAKERLKSPRARLFVALELPGEVREALAEWQRGFTDPALRPVRPASLHLTLVFIGYRAEREIPAIAEAALATRAPAPEVRFERVPVGVPPRGRPRLFALEAPSEALVALQAEVEGNLVRAGFHEAEKRPYWPHLTVARVRPEKRGSRRPAEVGEPPQPLPERMFRLFRPFPCVRLVLFRSHLRRSGAEYESMAELELPTAETRER